MREEQKCRWDAFITVGLFCFVLCLGLAELEAGGSSVRSIAQGKAKSYVVEEL